MMHSHVGEWEDGTEESEREVLRGLGKCRGLRALKVRVEHMGRHYESRGVDEGVGARRWREELGRRMTRSRLAVGEVEEGSLLENWGEDGEEGGRRRCGWRVM